jgi:hypothetical protein
LQFSALVSQASDAPNPTALETERDDLYRKVGELEMQRDFLKKTLINAGL